jgi:hypothetical protein
MFGFLKPKLPVTPEQMQWVDGGLVRLAEMLGSDRLLQASVMLPISEHFPDTYDRSETALGGILFRVASAMRVDPSDVEITLFAEDGDIVSKLVPYYSKKTAGAAGLYYHDPENRPRISVNENQLEDPTALVATLAHELGHILLLRPGLVDRDEADMEPLTDLLTVFLGLGVFTANSAFRFTQFSGIHTQGWSSRRQGYLPEEMFGYALARFAWERGEAKPKWADHLSTNVASYFKRSAAWIAANRVPRLITRA